MSAEGFEHELEQVYERYRHRELDERLDEVAKTMEEGILQKILAEAIFGIEIEAQGDTERAVQQMNSHLDMNNLNALVTNSAIDSLRIKQSAEKPLLCAKNQLSADC